ncbi:MAG: M6 family metalloprotease domain-containing protein [Muribaculaceae bacterium]|nr:M6 family metalloprotease domain-containing protein [Muribaculaceae bacterium]
MRVISISAALCALAVPLVMNAVPADPSLMRFYNSDDTYVEGYLVGDENFHYVMSSDRSSLLERDFSGFWKPAVRSGQKLSATESNIDLLRKEVNSKTCRKRLAPPQYMGMLNNEGRTTYPTTSEEEVHALVVLIEYADTKFTVPDIQESINRLCNEEGYSEYEAKGSARDYYRAVSGGKFNPVFDVTRPITLNHTSQHYVGTAQGSFMDHFGEAIEQSLTELHDSGDVDFSKYDYDNDGVVDNVYFFFAGYGQADTGRTDCIWPHQADYKVFMDAYGMPELVFDGKRIASYACSAELKGSVPQNYQPYLTGIGTFCHEYGHVLGLPDLYDAAGGNTQSPGYWDIMANGSYNDRSTCPPMMSAYERWLCRWIELERAEDGTLYSLPAATKDNCKALRIDVTSDPTQATSEFFIIESRMNESWDKSLEDYGLLIWHIDYDYKIWNNNIVNSFNKPHVIMMAANRSKKQITWPGKDGEYSMTYPEMPNGLVPFAPIPEDFNIFLTDIRYDAGNGTGEVFYNRLSDYPTDVVTLNPEPEFIEEMRRVVLSWEPTAESDSDDEYRLTVKRFGTDGKEYIVDGMDDKPVGKSVTATIGNISPSAWKQDFEAYVRTVRYGIPAKTTSNVIHFNPAKGTSMVQTIDTEESVGSRHHQIFAPESARIFRIDGVEVSNRENLPSGIYIVKCDKKAFKVRVD